MRIYGAVQVSFWESPETQSLSDQAKLLAIYLQTGRHSNMLGCYRLPLGYIIEDLNWQMETVQQALDELAAGDFLVRDKILGWIVIKDFLKWNPIQNNRQGYTIQKLFNSVPDKVNVRGELIKCLLKEKRYLDPTFIQHLKNLDQENPIDFVSATLLNEECLREEKSLNEECMQQEKILNEDCTIDKDQEQDQNQNQDKDQNQYQEKKERTSMSGKPDVLPLKTFSFEKQKTSALKAEALEVLNFLNKKTEKVFRASDTNLNLIIARLKTGATVSDCKQIIAKKNREWRGDPKMAEYLRPATLFNANKFEQYIGELVLPKED